MALVYDWQVRWACEISQGPGGSFGSHEHAFIAAKDQGHWHTVQRFYRALWRQSISTDVVTLDDELADYELLILPHTFMISEGQAQAIERFVARGGTVLGTAMTGQVDDTMLVHRGGLPGAGLHRLFGVVAEEVDTLRPSDSQHLQFPGQSEPISAGPYCHLMRFSEAVEDVAAAEVIATYGEQFYAGSPALTKRQHGQGSAWWLACECDEEGTAQLCHRPPTTGLRHRRSHPQPNPWRPSHPAHQ